MYCTDDVDNQNETQEGDDEEENPEKDPVPCLQANTKEDGYVNGLCICKDGFSGVFCEASDTCDSGATPINTIFFNLSRLIPHSK